MKKFSTFIIVSLLSASLTAGDNKNRPGSYCAELKDGMKVVMHEGSAITKDITLSNGTQIQRDGTVIKNDGTKIELREGECINIEGVIDNGKPETDPTNSKTPEDKKDPNKGKKDPADPKTPADQKNPNYKKDQKDPKSPKDSMNLKDSKNPPPMNHK